MPSARHFSRANSQDSAKEPKDHAKSHSAMTDMMQLSSSCFVLQESKDAVVKLPSDATLSAQHTSL